MAAAAAGGLAAMAIGSLLRARAPVLILFAMLTVAPMVAAGAAWFFSLGAVIAVAFAAILRQPGQAGPGLDRAAGDRRRDPVVDFAVSETLNQVANVAGGLTGVLVSMPRQRRGGAWPSRPRA